MQGEVAIAAFPRASTILNTDDVPQNTPPAVGIKIGNGSDPFSALPWLQGIAADVYSWAKAENPPVYEAKDIIGLKEFIEENSSGGGSGGGSAAAAYRIVYNSNTNKYILQYYDNEEEEWVNTTSEINLYEIYNRIDTIERWANGANSRLGNIELPLAEYVYEEVLNYMNRLSYDDGGATEHQFVTSVVQDNGKISVIRSIIHASDITQGVLTTAQGGTGVNYVAEDEILIGSESGELKICKFVTEIDSNRAAFATVGAIKDYVDAATAGLTGAMHFIGEATVPIAQSNSHVNPQIVGYNFNEAQSGDVILANNAQEFVWTGDTWRLLGDEGSYAVKGSIVNADIAENANIDQSKIENLIETLAEKVTVEEGKGLSTNNYSDEDKEKLDALDPNAQENIIEHIFLNNTELEVGQIEGLDKSVNLSIYVLSPEEIEKIAIAESNYINHIFVNGTELTPSVVNNLPKSVIIDFIPFTQEEKDKLHDIESEAQVNKLETITVNGEQYIPDNNKNIDITIDQAALNLDVIAGARVPTRTQGTYEEVDITRVNGEKFLELASIAKTGILCENENYWNSSSIIPLNGELIIYGADNDHDYARLKVGDGVRSITALPFIDAGTINGNDLPENAVICYNNSDDFPTVGIQNTLYVDLETNRIYCYTPLTGFIQLSNFTYSIEQVTASHIISYSNSIKPTFTCEEGILKISSGSSSSLNFEPITVVKNITKGVVV